MSIDATETRIKFEVSFPGDDGHVSHRVAEVIKAMTALGIRLQGRLDGGRYYLLADHEDAVDTSTLDGHETLDRAVQSAVATTAVCGMAVCGHEWHEHNMSRPSAKAGAADPPGAHCRAVEGGHPCRCPGFTRITTGESDG